jgi:hypothetical protein
MNPLSKFLERYLHFTPPALLRSRAISRALFEKLGIVCSEDAVAVRGDIAFLRLDGMMKSEITLHKPELLKRIQELGGGALSDLR